ncbi:hypothetical protein SAMN04488563_5377 [Jiangella alkaliphila]|uniref:Uncharacterized protein n=1 Tax=Jiangella alkaliphila TaxID=419479 RepID=A0A1H2L8E3_9ACTN|nr:hypothetical protein SAMN04488563_5377 [Jiangella alkaliphila]
MMTMVTEQPGQEIVDRQIRQRCWRYARGKGHPRVYPPNRSQTAIVPTSTPNDDRALKKFVSLVGRVSGEWPPGRRA